MTPVEVMPPVASKEGEPTAGAVRQDGPACTLRSAHWPYTAALLGRPDGPGLLQVSGDPSIEVSLPSGASRAAKVALSRSGVRLWGWFDAKQLPLHASHAITLGGVVAPTPAAMLLWGPSRPDAIAVGYVFDDAIAPDVIIWSTLRCKDVALAPQGYDAIGAVPFEGALEDALLAAGSPIGLSIAAGGPAAVWLDPAEDVDVEVAERQRGQARILLSTDDAAIFGWVSERFVRAARPDRIGSAWGMGRLGLFGTAEPVELLMCSHAVGLYTRRAGEAVEVGEAEPGVRIGVLGADQDYTTVALPDEGWFKPTDGGTLAVATSALENCEPVVHR